MKPITQEMLTLLIQKLQVAMPRTAPQVHLNKGFDISGIPINAPMDDVTLALMGKQSESTAEIAKLESALALISSDTGYGTGRFYDSNGKVEPDYWLAGVWALASLGWPSIKETARKWSQTSSRYTEEGSEKAWNSYNPAHPNAIGIGSLYKRAKELGWSQENLPIQVESENERLRFNLLGINELDALPLTEDLIKGVLPKHGIGAIYGPSGSGKTFVALDLLMAVACQSEWFGYKVKKNAPVTYVGLEGKSGIKNRIKAWRLKNNASPSNFKVILDRLDLRKKSDINALTLAIRNANMAGGVVVIDTLNQATPGADENSSIDMGIAISHLQQLQELLGGLVLIIHHTGKNPLQGLRGHSSLKAALDANIEVIGGDKKAIVLDKVKDGEDGQSHPFRLAAHTLGFDSDGDPITSCTVERDCSLLFTKPEPSGSKQKVALKAIKQALANSTDKRMTVEAAVFEIAKSLITTPSNKRNNSARQLLGSLTAGGFLSSELIDDEGWVWLP